MCLCTSSFPPLIGSHPLHHALHHFDVIHSNHLTHAQVTKAFRELHFTTLNRYTSEWVCLCCSLGWLALLLSPPLLVECMLKKERIKGWSDLHERERGWRTVDRTRWPQPKRSPHFKYNTKINVQSHCVGPHPLWVNEYILCVVYMDVRVMALEVFSQLAHYEFDFWNCLLTMWYWSRSNSEP